VISEEERCEILDSAQSRLEAIGFGEPIREDRYLLRVEKGAIVRDAMGRPEITICINGYRALENGLLSLNDYRLLEESVRTKMHDAGYEALRLKGDHLLLSMTPDGELVRTQDGAPRSILCNFELIRAPWMRHG
jgi:hypothetical protein